MFELNGGDGANWRLEGLTNGQQYRVSFIAADGTGFGGANTYNTQYSVYDADPGANGVNKGTVNLLDSVDVNPGDLGAGGFDGTWTAGVTYGSIDFTANATSMYGLWEKLPAGNHSGIGAVQIETVPEPSSSLLLALGSLGLIARRRRQDRIRSPYFSKAPVAE
ncbi:MAG: PEP-CTERM sorting domain-containing protein [Akkermansiaceae bacterium]